MKKSTLWLLAILAVVFLGVCILLSGGIYTTVHTGPFVYKVNRFTGASELLVRDVSMKVESKGTAKELPRGTYLGENDIKSPASTSSFSGKALFFMMCGICHSLDRITSRTENREKWALIVKDMQRKKSDLISDAEAAKILEYLTTEHGRGR